MTQVFNNLPKYIRIDLGDVYDRLDRLNHNKELPTIDTEAILSALVDSLYRPSIGGTVDQTVRSVIIDTIGVMGVEKNNYYLLHTELYNTLFSLLGCFTHYQLYTENRLLYDYARRFTKTSALLQRKNRPCL